MNEQKREDIINAAVELIALQGFHNAPMSMIAERAKVGAGTIYRFFAGKEELITKTYFRVEERLTECVMENYVADQSVHERFSLVCRGLINYFLFSGNEFLFIDQFFNSPYGANICHKRINEDGGIISSILKEGQQLRILKQLPLPVLNALALGPLIQICRYHVLRYAEVDDAVIHGTVEACWDAVKDSSIHTRAARES